VSQARVFLVGGPFCTAIGRPEMAPKDKKAPKEKKAAKAAKAVKAKTILPSQTPVEAQPDAEPPVEEPEENASLYVDAVIASEDPKRRRLIRRDTEEQCMRLIKVQLQPLFGKAVVGKVSKSGIGVIEYMMNILRELKCDGKYWTSKQWQDLYVEFELALKIEDKLDNPSLEEPVRDSLLVALQAPYAKNPAERSAEPVERFLETCPNLNMTEIYGLFIACAESPIVNKNVHAKLFVAIAKYFARTYTDTKYMCRKIE
jgi:hypothetical protein